MKMESSEQSVQRFSDALSLLKGLAEGASSDNDALNLPQALLEYQTECQVIFQYYSKTAIGVPHMNVRQLLIWLDLSLPVIML